MNDKSSVSNRAKLCAKGPMLAIAGGVGAALSVSNGPAVGIAVGAALGLVFWLRQRRKHPRHD